jgi:proteasome accessory factor B
MADKKAERLINLTLALLATKRFLKKSEIFTTVHGYSGNAESMDRMFERDKNELRSLGIDISVGDLDPLFDDEPGYRIFKDSYALQLKNLDPVDVALLSVAAKLWNDSILGIEAQAGLLKLESLGDIENDGGSFAFSYRYENPSNNLVTLESAIFDEKIIEFLYRDGGTKRLLEPYKIYLWRGFWYLFGKDIDKNEMRSFKVSRINGEVEITKKKFKMPENIELSKFLPKPESFQVVLQIPEGRGAVLRNMGAVTSTIDNVDTCLISFSDSESALREILRHGRDVKILEPDQLRNAIRNHLEVLSNV